MRKIITAVVLGTLAGITTAWSVSTFKPSIATKTELAIGGGGAVPTRSFPLW